MSALLGDNQLAERLWKSLQITNMFIVKNNPPPLLFLRAGVHRV